MGKDSPFLETAGDFSVSGKVLNMFDSNRCRLQTNQWLQQTPDNKEIRCGTRKNTFFHLNVLMFPMLCQFWMYELRFCLHKLPSLGGNSSIQNSIASLTWITQIHCAKNHLDRVEPHKLWRERDATHKLWRIKPLFYPWVLQNKGATIFHKNPFSENLLQGLCPSCILHRKDTMPELFWIENRSDPLIFESSKSNQIPWIIFLHQSPVFLQFPGHFGRIPLPHKWEKTIMSCFVPVWFKKLQLWCIHLAFYPSDI